MKKTKTFFARYLKGENAHQTLAILSVASIFMPYVISATVILAVVFRALILKDSREKIFSQSGFKIILVFILFNFAAPVIHRNYIGIACFFAISVILIFALYLRSVMTKALFYKICDVSAFMSMCCAVAATFIKAPEHSFRSPSVFFNPNYYGAMITFVVLLCVYRILSKNGNLIFLLATIAFNIYGLLMADCQSAFFAIGFGVWLMLLFKKCYKSFAAVSALTVLVIIFLPSLDFILPRISNAVENITIRASIWKAGLRGILDTPIFGRGLMGYRQIYSLYGGSVNNHCHNIFIDMLLSFGIIGSIPLLVFVTKSILKARGKKTASLIFALLGAVLLHGLVDVTIIWIQTGAFAAFLLCAPYIQNKDGR